MNTDVIKSYLVSLGYEVDQPTLNKFNDALRGTAIGVASMTEGMAAAFIEAGAAVVAALTGIAIGTVALMESTAKADLGYQMFARRMYMSVDAAKQLKIATDALGYSMEDIIWGPPEVRERYAQLIQDQKNLQAGIGTGFEGEMKKIRDISFEFTRLKVEAQYFVMGLAKSLSIALTGDENGILNRLRDWNQWLIQNIPQLASKFSDYLAPVLRDVKAIWSDMANILQIVASEFFRLIGMLENDSSLKSGKVTIDNFGKAMDYLANATRKVFDAFNAIAEFFHNNNWLLGVIHPGYAGVQLGNWVRSKLFPDQSTAGGSGASPTSSGGSGIQAMVRAAAEKYGIDPNIALAVAQKESGFNPNAVNRKDGGYGTMQLMPDTAKALGVNRYDTGQNIEGGVRLLAENMQRYGNWRQALEAYNGGGKAARTGFNKDYAEDVLNRANQFSITINVTQPGATAPEIAHHVKKAIEAHAQEASLRSLVQAKSVGNYA